MQRKHTIYNHQGFTLVELTIVLAISAIISVMIVSFSVLISAQVKKNNLRADFLEDVIALRTDLKKQFAEDNAQFDIENPEFSFDLGNYEHINNVTFSCQDNILKVVVLNNSLNETQSFVLISKVSTSSTASAPPSPTGEYHTSSTTSGPPSPTGEGKLRN